MKPGEDCDDLAELISRLWRQGQWEARRRAAQAPTLIMDPETHASTPPSRLRSDEVKRKPGPH